MHRRQEPGHGHAAGDAKADVDGKPTIRLGLRQDARDDAQNDSLGDVEGEVGHGHGVAQMVRPPEASQRPRISPRPTVNHALATYSSIRQEHWRPLVKNLALSVLLVGSIAATAVFAAAPAGAPSGTTGICKDGT